jgi:transcriptional regulator with XRE-family HTH domain
MRPASGKSGKSAAAVAAARKPRPSAKGGQRRAVTEERKATGVAGETDALIRAIGTKLRTVRQARGLTLLDLAGRTGLSSSMLSLLERGKSAPSIGTLVAIGSALGVSTTDILASPAETGPKATVSRRADQPVHATPDGVRRRILRSDPGHGIEIAMVEFGPGTASVPHPRPHGGYEFGIAMQGELEVTVGTEVLTLRAGDLVSYRSTDPHRIANRGKRTALAIWVNLRQG